MALIPSLQISYLGGTIVLTDATVYGAPEYERNQVTVNFKLEKVTSGSQTEISLPVYDEVTVVSVSQSVNDGFYIGTLTITPNDLSGDLTDSEPAFVTDALETCRDNARDDMECTCCENSKVRFEKFNKIRVAKLVIDELVSEGKHSLAQCILEGVQSLCSTKSDCT